MNTEPNILVNSLRKVATEAKGPRTPQTAVLEFHVNFLAELAIEAADLIEAQERELTELRRDNERLGKLERMMEDDAVVIGCRGEGELNEGYRIAHRGHVFNGRSLAHAIDKIDAAMKPSAREDGR